MVTEELERVLGEAIVSVSRLLDALKSVQDNVDVSSGITTPRYGTHEMIEAVPFKDYFELIKFVNNGIISGPKLVSSDRIGSNDSVRNYKYSELDVSRAKSAKAFLKHGICIDKVKRHLDSSLG